MENEEMENDRWKMENNIRGLDNCYYYIVI